MAFDYLKVFTPRRLAIDYIAPPICEGDFSSTGSPFISLLPLLGPASPTGLVAEGMGGRFNLRWDNIPGVLCWSVYRANDREDPYGDYTLIAECVNDSTIPLDPGCYRIAAITQDGVSELSDPVCYDKPEEPEPICPTWVMTPEASYSLTVGDSLSLTAEAVGDLPIDYTWWKDAAQIGVGPTISLLSATLLDAGSYAVIAAHEGCAPIEFDFSIAVQAGGGGGGCVPDTGPDAPAWIEAANEYDYATVESVGVFDVPYGVDGGCPATVGRAYLDCGAFAAGWYEVFLTQVGGWSSNADPQNDAMYALGWGVEMQTGGFPVDVLDEPVIGCYGWDFTDHIPCLNPAGFIDWHYGASSLPVSLVGLTEHSGGSIRIWGPSINDIIGVCGLQSQFEIKRHSLADMPATLRIANMPAFVAALTLCDTCQDRAGVEWDGTFYRSTYNPWDLRYEIPAPFNSDTISLGGKRISRSSCSIFLSELNDGTPIWMLVIKCKRVSQSNGGTAGDVVWQGYKVAGRTPDGTYMHTDSYAPWAGQSCSPTPACLTIEAV